MRIALIVEGKTETAFLPHLRSFLAQRLSGRMPKFDAFPYDGRIPKGNKLKRDVERLLADRKTPANAVIALTDVYTGANPPDFADAADAKIKMRQWVGPNERFFPHAAQYDFEAWLLPYWSDIQKLAGGNRAAPGPEPEKVNHQHPPAQRIQELFITGSRGRAYIKARDAGRILQGKDLTISAWACPEFKSFLNTILSLCGGTMLV